MTFKEEEVKAIEAARAKSPADAREAIIKLYELRHFSVATHEEEGK